MCNDFKQHTHKLYRNFYATKSFRSKVNFKVVCTWFTAAQHRTSGHCCSGFSWRFSSVLNFCFYLKKFSIFILKLIIDCFERFGALCGSPEARSEHCGRIVIRRGSLLKICKDLKRKRPILPSSAVSIGVCAVMCLLWSVQTLNQTHSSRRKQPHWKAKSRSLKDLNQLFKIQFSNCEKLQEPPNLPLSLLQRFQARTSNFASTKFAPTELSATEIPVKSKNSNEWVS